MPLFDSFENIVTDVLDRADEPTDGTSDWDTAVRRAVPRAFHDLLNRHPWWFNRADPPGALRIRQDITTITITVATAGASVTLTFSANPLSGVSLTDWFIRPGGKDYHYRITAHTANATTCTIDLAPETIAAGTASTIYLIEYTLASDFEYFEDGLWTQNGEFIPVVDQQTLRALYPDPPTAGWPPALACLMDDQKVRFSSYLSAGSVDQRVEYGYHIRRTDPSGTSDLIIPRNFRPLLSDAALYFVYLMKSDKRAGEAKQEYERGIQQMLSHDTRVKLGVGVDAGRSVRSSPYADQGGYYR